MMDIGQQKCNVFKNALHDPAKFCISWEQVPGRGAFEKQHEVILQAAEQAAKGRRVHAISITDGPGGSPAIASTMLSAEIQRLDIEPLVHFALRDVNRIAVESHFYGLNSAGVCNLFIVSGDYPAKGGYNGQAGRVFDVDPVHVMQLIEEMNQGLNYQVMGKTRTLSPTNFFAGVAVSPFKQLESEIMCQYYKLGKKINAGAHFVISQVGFDARKMQEPLLWLKHNNLQVPMMANIYVLSFPAGRVMNENQVPGCVVTDKLLSHLESESQSTDKGRAARLLRAAKMFAIAKGLGYKGAHIGGHGLSYDMVEYIIGKGEELYPRWPELVTEFDFPQKDGFYLYEKDTKTGLNSELSSKRKVKGRTSPAYSFSRQVHRFLFQPGKLLFRPAQKFACWVDNKKRIKNLFTRLEHQGKDVLYECLRCGDCALMDLAYLCPTSQCPKGERLGPCGGSYQGWCEVYPNERQCIWVRAYDRLKAYREEASLGAYTSLPRDWELWQTSSWLNYFMGRDHTAKRLGLKAPAQTPAKTDTTPPDA